MFVNFDNPFGSPLEMFGCTIEIEVDGNTQRQTMQAPQMILTNQFVNLVQQAINTNQKVRVKMSRTAASYGEWDKQWHNIEHYIEFKNNPYLQDEENKE